MNLIVIFLPGFLGLVLSIEIVSWFLFRRKLEGILFSKNHDKSFFRFFTLLRLKSIATIHTLFLLSFITITFLSIW